MILLPALLALSLGNAVSSLWADQFVGTSLWQICNVLSGLTQWALPAMALTMGSVFLSAEKRMKTSTLWKRYIPLAAAGCLFWWLAASVVWLQDNHPQDLDLLTFRECMAEVLDSPGNIGYCQMIVSFFVLYPLLHRIAASRKLLAYGIGLFYALSLLNTVLHYIPYLSAVTLFTDQLNWGYYRAWTFYLLCGAWMTRYEVRWEIRLIIYAAGLLATGGMIALTSLTTSVSPGYANEYIGYTSPLVGLQTLAVALLIRTVFTGCGHPLPAGWSRNVWYSVPVLFTVSIFIERLINAFTDLPLWGSALAAVLNAVAAYGIVLAFGRLPGFKALVGDYSRQGGMR